MQPVNVVERIDVVRNRSGGFRASFEGLMIEHLAFDRREKALSNSVVPAVALTAHARSHRVVRECFAVVETGINAAAVGVMQQLRMRPPASRGAFKSFQCELAVVVCAGCPTNDTSRAQVQNCREVKPSLMRPNVRDVCDPCGVWLRHVKLAIEDVGS